ncbi:Rap1a/Tai family immunity protein [Arenimonas caeni]|uniref:Rap1a/Tai family immunity protein n=1 Tax=Arenimonas caeni TaxID=2058085 RepID=UPI003CCE2C69
MRKPFLPSVLICSLLLLQPAPAFASNVSTERLETWCSGISRSDEATELHGLCLGYVTGFLDGYYTASWALPADLFCLPEGSSTVQVARVFIKWASANPNKVHKPAGEGLYSALIEGFPCGNQ